MPLFSEDRVGLASCQFIGTLPLPGGEVFPQILGSVGCPCIDPHSGLQCAKAKQEGHGSAFREREGLCPTVPFICYGPHQVAGLFSLHGLLFVRVHSGPVRKVIDLKTSDFIRHSAQAWDVVLKCEALVFCSPNGLKCYGSFWW